MLVGETKTGVLELTGVKNCKPKNPIKIITPNTTLIEIIFPRDILEDCFLDLFNNKRHDLVYIISN